MKAILEKYQILLWLSFHWVHQTSTFSFSASLAVALLTLQVIGIHRKQENVALSTLVSLSLFASFYRLGFSYISEIVLKYRQLYDGQTLKTLLLLFPKRQISEKEPHNFTSDSPKARFYSLQRTVRQNRCSTICYSSPVPLGPSPGNLVQDFCSHLPTLGFSLDPAREQKIWRNDKKGTQW